MQNCCRNHAAGRLPGPPFEVSAHLVATLSLSLSLKELRLSSVETTVEHVIGWGSGLRGLWAYNFNGFQGF